MRYAWIFILPLLGVLAASIVVVWRIRQQKYVSKRNALLAHTAPVKALPAYRRAQKIYHTLIIVVLLLFVACMVMGSIVAGRPIMAKKNNNSNLRDIMFCLDASSLDEESRGTLVQYFETLAERYENEHIGISLFDEKAIALSALSDDYDAIGELAKNYNKYFELYNNELGNNETRIGEGVISCLDNFGILGKSGRAQSLIIVSDAKAAKAQRINLGQALNYAQAYNVTAYGIDVSSSKANKKSGEDNTSSNQFRQAVNATGGGYYDLAEENLLLAKALAQIEEQDSARVGFATQKIENDTPQVACACLVLVVVLELIVVARLKL